MNPRYYRYFATLVLALLTLSPVRADVTTRYKTEITMNPALAAMVGGAMKGAGLDAPQEMALRLKGGKGVSASMGLMTIVDFPTKEMTVVDPATKAYAKMTYDQFIDEATRAMPKVPDQARAAMATAKSSVTPARLTGRTAVIQGVEAEEREMVVSVDGPAVPNAPASPSVRMVMQIWTAKAGEALRVPAIRELAGYSLYSYATMSPLGGIDKMLEQLPGFAKGFQPIFKEMQNAGPLLRMHTDIFMPAMAAMLRQMAARGNSTGAALDYDAPFMQMNEELVELSSTPIPDSVFQIPEGYRQTPASELIQAIFAKSTAAVKQ